MWLGEDHRGWDHIRVHVQVVLDRRVDPYAFAVYCALAKHAESGNGESYPSAETVAGYFGISERTVSRATKVLEELGYVRVERGSGVANRYFLLPPPAVGPPTHSQGSGTPTPDSQSGDPGLTVPPTPDSESDELEPGNENQELELLAPPSGAALALLGFEAFWSAWPERNGKKLHRAKAEPLWARLDAGGRRAALRGALNYADASRAGLAGAMDAFRWLRDRGWDDWQEPAVPDRRGRPSAADGLSAEARAELEAHYRGNGRGHPPTPGVSGLPSGRGGEEA